MSKIILFSFLFFQWNAEAHNTVRNGGDAVASKFVNLARLTVNDIKLTKMNPKLEQIVLKIEKSLGDVQVNSQLQLFLKGDEVDAINYPLQKKIVVNRARWQNSKLLNLESRMRFVLHEYLGANGFRDQNYQLSHQILDYLSPQMLSDVDLQDAFFQDIINIHATFWFYAGYSEPLDFGEFCMSSGELRVLLPKISSTAQKNSHWFGSKSFLKDLSTMDRISKKYEKICRDHIEDIKELNDLSWQGVNATYSLDVVQPR